MFEKIDFENLQARLEITEAAVEAYIENDGSFTFKEVAQKTGHDVGSVFEYFPNKKSVLEFYYTSLAIRYRLMIDEIEDFESYSLSEKLSNFIYASFDMMQEQEAFVRATFNSLIRHRYSASRYEKYIEEIFRTFLKEDKGVAASSSIIMRPFFFKQMRRKYLLLVKFWLADESEGREKTMELTDKVTDFIQEIMYSAVIDKGFELIKFLVANDVFTKNIPFWDEISSKIEIRE